MFTYELQEFQKSFTNFVVKDVEKSLKGDLEVGTIILVVIGIECLSGYYVSQKQHLHTPPEIAIRRLISCEFVMI